MANGVNVNEPARVGVVTAYISDPYAGGLCRHGMSQHF